MENFDIRKFHLQCEYASLENQCKKLAKEDKWHQFDAVQERMTVIERILENQFTTN